MRKVYAGEVGTIIVKDMSRLGRDYLKVGVYTEITFPEAGVRFIAFDGVYLNAVIFAASYIVISVGSAYFTLKRQNYK